MRHRGPDSEAVAELVPGQLVLEHCRLAIIDPENREADQPFSDPSGRFTIIYNGELFNYRELRTELERRSVSFRTDSDTEVVLHSFIADGERAFERFRGMFAFLIADRRTGDLLAVRDQIGVKPLYWYHRDGLFVAASEMRTVLGHPVVPRNLDTAAVIEYLAFGHNVWDGTLIEGVRELPPGHLIRVNEDRATVREYWDPLDVRSEVTEESNRAQLLDQLESAVAGSLVSDVPVSLMLSGGLDSSTIAVLAARITNPAHLHSYSVSFGLPSDESPVAERLARELGMRHRTILLTRERVAMSFDRWLTDLDVPTANPTWVAVSEIARAVAADSGKVLLGGDGGDELFGGYSRWMKYLRFHDVLWRRTPDPAKRAAGRLARPALSGLAGDIARRAAEDGELFVGSRPFHDDDLKATLGPAGLRGMTDHPPESGVDRIRRRFDDRTGRDGGYLQWLSYLSVKNHLVEDYLARLDKMGMAESVEGRVPLLDPELVRWSFGVSQGEMVPGYREKALFRATVSPILPDYILDRPKQGFCPPVVDWASSLLLERLPDRSPLVEAGLVSAHATAYLRGRGTSNAAFAAWTLGTLSHWAEAQL
jgi:asparagine synthase (glutamine-hydrolysing)